jgi:hypothetical protein
MSHWANTIHARALELVKIGFGSTFKTYRQTPMLQVQPGDLPVLAVHILREKRVPDGQPDQTMPKFIHDLTLGVSGAVHVETDKQDDILLSDPSFVRLTEGVSAMDRVGQYAKVGETTLFEIRVEMNIGFRSYFDPRVPDDFTVIHITTEFPDKAHADAGTPQLDREYDIEVGSKVLQQIKTLFRQFRKRGKAPPTPD